MKKIFLLGAGLMLSALNVNAMEMHPGPFIGINTFKDKCQTTTEDESFSFMGDAKTKFTMNKNFVIATCKADVENSMRSDMAGEEAIVERDDIPCRIAVRKPGSKPPMVHYDGMGGFTVTPSGNIKAMFALIVD